MSDRFAIANEEFENEPGPAENVAVPPTVTDPDPADDARTYDSVDEESLGDDDWESADAEAAWVSSPERDDREMLAPSPDTAWHGPLESIILKPTLFVLPIIVLVTLALLAGIVRKPVFTADSQLIVGSVVRDYQVNEGQSQAIKDLTDIYSRLVGSSVFMGKVDEAMGESVPGTALTAAPIPDSALIRLDAKGTSQEQAIARADAGAVQLKAYVSDLQAQSTTSSTKLEEIKAAAVELEKAETALTSAKNATLAASAQGLAAAQDAEQQAQATATAADLKLQTLKDNYQQIQQSGSGGIGLDTFAPAQPLGSDRKSTLQIYGIAALLIGALLGMALATLSANHWKLLPAAKEAEGSA